MTLLPTTVNPLVVRTDFDNQSAWDKICNIIRRPVHEAGQDFYADVEFLDRAELRNLTASELLDCLPGEYGHSFLFVVDKATTESPEFPLLVVDLARERGRAFRAIPSQIQGIENNLSLSNMDFFEFADNADQDGVFRGF
jgi:hypothetical protein